MMSEWIFITHDTCLFRELPASAAYSSNFDNIGNRHGIRRHSIHEQYYARKIAKE